jgi:hypothetical protein
MSDPTTAQSKDLRFYRRPWFFLASALLFWPLAVLLMWTGKTYCYKRGGGIAPLGRGIKAFLSVSMIFLGILWFARLAGDQPPSDDQTASGMTATPDQTPQSRAGSIRSAPQKAEAPPASQASSALEACDSESTKGLVKQIIEQNGAKLLDIGSFREIQCPTDRETTLDCVKPDGRERYCDATAYTDTTGTTAIRYHLFYGPSGKPLIEVQEGTWMDYGGLAKALSQAPARQANPPAVDDPAGQTTTDSDDK